MPVSITKNPSSAISMSKIILVLRVVGLALCLVLIACKTTRSYTSKTGVVGENKSLVSTDLIEIEVESYAQITEAGEQDAYDRALEHGFRKAVEKALGSIVQSKTIVENSTLINDKIVSQSRGFIKKHQILSDSNRGDTKIIKLRTWVAVGNIKKDVLALGLLQDRVGRPNLMVAIDELNHEGKPADIAKTVIYDFFEKKEFRFIDHPENARNEKGVFEEFTVRKLALEKGAQMLILGKVSFKEQKIKYLEDTDFSSIRSSLIIKVIYVGSGEIITSQTGAGVGSAIDIQVAHNNSIQKAFEQLNPKIFDAIIKHWNKTSNDGFEYEVLISGISFPEAKQIKNAIESKVEGIKKVFERNFKDGQMSYLVRYTGLSGQLASLLALPRKTGIELESIEVSDKIIKMKRR